MIPNLARLAIGAPGDSLGHPVDLLTPTEAFIGHVVQSIEHLLESDGPACPDDEQKAAEAESKEPFRIEEWKGVDDDTKTTIWTGFKMAVYNVSTNFPLKKGAENYYEPIAGTDKGVRFPIKRQRFGDTILEKEAKLTLDTAKLGISPRVRCIKCEEGDLERWVTHLSDHSKTMWGGIPTTSDGRELITWPVGYVYVIHHGESVASILQRGSGTPTLAEAIIEVIRLASKKGYIQMDMKPENLVAFNGADGNSTMVKIIDWDAKWCRKYCTSEVDCLEYLQLVALLGCIGSKQSKEFWQGAFCKSLRKRFLELNSSDAVCKLDFGKTSLFNKRKEMRKTTKADDFKAILRDARATGLTFDRYTSDADMMQLIFKHYNKELIFTEIVHLLEIRATIDKEEEEQQSRQGLPGSGGGSSGSGAASKTLEEFSRHVQEHLGNRNKFRKTS